jgi:hypothetical protein
VIYAAGLFFMLERAFVMRIFAFFLVAGFCMLVALFPHTAHAQQMNCRVEKAIIQYFDFAEHPNLSVYMTRFEEQAYEGDKVARKKLDELEKLNEAAVFLYNDINVCAEVARWRAEMNMGPDPQNTLDLNDCSHEKTIALREARIHDSSPYRTWMSTSQDPESLENIKATVEKLRVAKMELWEHENPKKACAEFDRLDKEFGVLPVKSFKWY